MSRGAARTPIPLRTRRLLAAMILFAACLIFTSQSFAQAPNTGQPAAQPAGTPSEQPAPALPEPPAPPAAQPPAPPTDVKAVDTPNDRGESITVTWTKSADDGAGRNNVALYEILKSDKPEGPFRSVGTAAAADAEYKDSDCKEGVPYYYKVVASDGKLTSDSTVFGPAKASAQWFNFSKVNLLLIALIISGSIIYFIEHLKSGKKLFVRKIAGMEAVDEAIGRATEMGRPILFVPGIMDMNDVQTVAAIIILGQIAKTVAEYDSKLMVPTSKSLVMTTARETVKEAYTAAGRPDAYNDDMITYLTDEQFAYVAGVNGLVVREKPATCIFLGSFYAEALILAEIGNSVGAIQIAGTAQPAQLPFFIASCDYTLIGEELFAASAYLSQDAKELGSLKGQDVGKAIVMISIVLGTILQTIAVISGSPLMVKASTWFINLFSIQP